MNKLTDQKIITSWEKNVLPWVKAIRENEIESRRLVTNTAIVKAVTASKPKTVLDVGCGEGWLARSLSASGIDVLGLDVISDFIIYAQRQGGGRFCQMAYEQISTNNITEQFDVVVCNFSLLGHASVNHLFQHVPSLLNDQGRFIVQTIHPIVGCGEQPYQDGWRAGSWAGFDGEFVDPAPWYFRTLESWQSLFIQSGFERPEIVEPLHPSTQQPASVIFIASRIKCGTSNESTSPT